MADKKIEVRELLTKKFCHPEYCLMHEVSNSAGFARTNSADAIFMGLWPSRGMEINGVEIKSSRSDWLRELKNPKKAEAIFKYCDRFWLAAEEKVIVNTDEIPVTWGYMLATGNKLKVIREAPKLTPEPISRGFIAAMLKRIAEGRVPIASLEEKVEEMVAQRVKQNYDINKSSLKNLQETHDNLLKEVREFEARAGVRIRGWERENVAEAVKVVMNTDMAQVVGTLKSNRQRLGRLLEIMDETINNHEKINHVNGNNIQD